MSEERSTEETGGSSTIARQRPREPGSGGRFSTDLTKSINQAFSLPTNPVMQAFRELQQSLVQPIAAAIRLSPSLLELASLKPAVPQYDLSPSLLELASLKPLIPTYNLGANLVELASLKPLIPTYNLGASVLELATREAVIPPYVLPGITDFVADQALWAQHMMPPWMTEISATLTDPIFPRWHTSLTHALEGLFREWSRIASFGADLPRRVAQAGLFAAMRAKAALLRGRLEDLDDFIWTWLRLRPTDRRREAVTLVLLGDEWIPADPETDAHLVLPQIKRLAAKEARAHKSIAETQLRGVRVVLMEAPEDTVADPATVEGLPIRGAFDDHRLNQVFAQLQPKERRVAYAYGEGGPGITWGEAALFVDEPAELGETVRRKCKRAVAELHRRAAVIGAAPPGLTATSGRR